MLYEYLKKCSLPLVIVFFTLTVLFHGFAVLTSYWLSDWSDSNIGLKNGTTANITLVARMTTYVSLGFTQRRDLLFSVINNDKK